MNINALLGKRDIPNYWIDIQIQMLRDMKTYLTPKMMYYTKMDDKHIIWDKYKGFVIPDEDFFLDVTKMRLNSQDRYVQPIAEFFERENDDTVLSWTKTGMVDYNIYKKGLVIFHNRASSKPAFIQQDFLKLYPCAFRYKSKSSKSPFFIYDARDNLLGFCMPHMGTEKYLLDIFESIAPKWLNPVDIDKEVAELDESTNKVLLDK